MRPLLFTLLLVLVGAGDVAILADMPFAIGVPVAWLVTMAACWGVHRLYESQVAAERLDAVNYYRTMVATMPEIHSAKPRYRDLPQEERRKWN